MRIAIAAVSGLFALLTASSSFADTVADATVALCRGRTKTECSFQCSGVLIAPTIALTAVGAVASSATIAFTMLRSLTTCPIGAQAEAGRQAVPTGWAGGVGGMHRQQQLLRVGARQHPREKGGEEGPDEHAGQGVPPGDGLGGPADGPRSNAVHGRAWRWGSLDTLASHPPVLATAGPQLKKFNQCGRLFTE